MVKASQKLFPILVDCDWGRKNQDIAKRYGVRGYPTVLFTDPKGEVLSKLKSRSPAGVTSQIEELTRKYRMKAVEAALEPVALPFGSDLAAALAEGKKQNKPVLAFFGDGGEDAITTARALIDKSIARTMKDFVTVQVPIKADCKICKRYKVRRGSMVKILDPTSEKSAAKALASIQGKRSAKSLGLSLKRARDKWAKGQEGL